MNRAVEHSVIESLAGKVVRKEPGAADWFAVEGIAGQYILLKSMRSGRLEMVEITESLLCPVGTEELARVFGNGVVQCNEPVRCA